MCMLKTTQAIVSGNIMFSTLTNISKLYIDLLEHVLSSFHDFKGTNNKFNINVSHRKAPASVLECYKKHAC